jgi:type II secretory pathway pseudopilin PulG
MRRSSALGASLIELLVLVGVLVVLVLTALPQLLVPVQIPARRAAGEVAADLGLARQLAIATRGNYVVAFTPAAGPYTSYAVAPQGGTPGPDFPKIFPVGVTVTGTQQITFAPNGSASTSAALTFADGAATAQVQVVAATGFVQETGP